MKRNSLTFLLAAAVVLLAGVQTAKAQKQGSTAEGKVKVVLYMAGNQTFECNITQLDSITFEEEHEWVDLGLPSGTLWATCNVGANSPKEYGDYFAWGETEPKEDYSWSTYKYCEGSYNTMTKYCTDSSYGYNGFTDKITELLPEDDAATANWGKGWQIPSDGQRDELISHTTHTWITQNGVWGLIFTSTNNGNTIFLPAAGVRYNSSFGDEGIYGNYWTRTLGHGTDPKARRMYFNSNKLDTGGDYRYRFYGESVRPVRVKTH